MDVRQRLLPLARWVATYKRSHGKAPTEADVPPDLAHLWAEFQAAKTALAASAALRPQPMDTSLDRQQRQQRQQQASLRLGPLPASSLPTGATASHTSPSQGGAPLPQGSLSPSPSPSCRAARPLVARALRHVHASTAATAAAAASAAAAANASSSPAVQWRQRSPERRALFGGLAEPDGDADRAGDKENCRTDENTTTAAAVAVTRAATVAAAEGSFAIPFGKAVSLRAPGPGEEEEEVRAAAAMPPPPPLPPLYGTPARGGRATARCEGAAVAGPRVLFDGGSDSGGGGGTKGTPIGRAGTARAVAGGGGGAIGSYDVSDDEVDELPPTPLSQIRRSGPVGGAAAGRCGVRQLGDGGGIFSPPRPGGGGVGDSAVKETPPESIRRRSRLFESPGGAGGGGGGGPPPSPVPYRLYGACCENGENGLPPPPPQQTVAPSPGRALARQLVQRRSVGDCGAAVPAPAAVARNPFSRIANMRAAVQRESEAAAAAAAAVAAMQAEQAAEMETAATQRRRAAEAPATGSSVLPPPPPLPPPPGTNKRRARVPVPNQGPSPATAAASPAAAGTAAAAAVSAAAAAASSGTPMRLLRRALEQGQAAEGGKGHEGPPGSPYSPLPVRRRPLLSAAAAAGASAVGSGDGHADTATGGGGGSAFFAARAAAAAPSVAIVAWRSAPADEADDIALRRLAEGYDALAAEADAALALGGEDGAVAARTRTAAGGRPYGDAQAEMRQLIMAQASEAVDLDKLALLGPRGAEAAGIRSPGTVAATAAAAGAVHGTGGAGIGLHREPLAGSTAAAAAAGTAEGDGADGGDDDDECDVAEELLPAAVREEIRLRRRALRHQRQTAAAAAPPPPQVVVEAEEFPRVTAAPAGAAADRRQALRRQLLGSMVGATAAAGAAAVSVGVGPAANGVIATATAAVATANGPEIIDRDACTIPPLFASGRRSARQSRSPPAAAADTMDGSAAVVAAAAVRVDGAWGRDGSKEAANASGDASMAAGEATATPNVDGDLATAAAAAAQICGDGGRAGGTRGAGRAWRGGAATAPPGKHSAAAVAAATATAAAASRGQAGQTRRSGRIAHANSIDDDQEVIVDAGGGDGATTAKCLPAVPAVPATRPRRAAAAAAVAAAALIGCRNVRAGATDDDDDDDDISGGDSSGRGDETATDGGGDSSESGADRWSEGGGASEDESSGSGNETESGSQNPPARMGFDGSDDDDDDAPLVRRSVRRRGSSTTRRKVQLASGSDEGLDGPAVEDAVQAAVVHRRRKAVSSCGDGVTSTAAPPPAVAKPKRAPWRGTSATGGDGAGTPKRRRTASATADPATAGAGEVATAARPAKRARRTTLATAATTVAGGRGAYGGGFGTASVSGGCGGAFGDAAAAAGGGGPAAGAAAGAAATSHRPKHTIRDACGNFVKISKSGSRPKHSFRFEGRSSAADRALKASQTRRRRVINGKVVITGGRVPHAAGQGADYLEGFGQGSRCFKCGSTGHWARDCPGTQGLGSPSQRAKQQQQQQGEQGGAAATATATAPAAAAARDSGGGGIGAIPTAPSRGLGFGGGGNFVLQARGGRQGPVEYPKEPLQLDQLVAGMPSQDQIAVDPRVVSDDQLAAVLRAVWGHPDFRGRQLELVRAVLEGRSMLAVLPTGAGKSLTYQLPAVLLPGVTLVVSPLLALMDDQLNNLPQQLQGRGASLSGGQTREQVDAALSAATRGSVKLLYVAPEKLLTPWLLAALRRLHISLIAVDEAHCVSEWGHSFRPAYLRLGHVLRCVLQPRCVLGLTATATTPTADEVAAVLGLAPGAVMREPPLRQNLRLKVLHMKPGASESGASRTALLQLLRSQELAAVQSVLVYVAMQWQADEVAGWLQSTHGISASSYHAGRPLPERNAVAVSFRTGRTRVVVATVAFGMGVDHPSIGAVVHLQMPRSLEDYVQQAGRAGRDGREARCYLFLDDQDYQRYRSLAFSGSTELAAVEAFLNRIFAPQPLLPPSPPPQPSGSGGGNDNDGNIAVNGVGSSFGVLQLNTTASELDIGEEVMETIMSYLQQDEPAAAGGGGGGGYVSVLPSCAAQVNVYFHRAPPAALAAKWPVVAAMLACRPPPRVHRGCHKVDMAVLVAAGGGGGISSSQALRQLSQLAALGQIHFEPVQKLRAISWQLLRRPSAPPGWAPPPLPPPQRQQGTGGRAAAAGVSLLAVRIHSRLEAQMAAAAARLDMVWGLMAGAFLEGASCTEQETFLRPRITSYFDAPYQSQLPKAAATAHPEAASAIAAAASAAGAAAAAPLPPPLPRSPPECPPLPLAPRSSNLVLEVEAFLTGSKARAAAMSVPLTSVAVARILHGLAGPAFPADAWRKAHEWGRFKAVDFPYVRAVAAMVLARRAAAAAAGPQGNGRARLAAAVGGPAAGCNSGGNTRGCKRRLMESVEEEEEADE